MLDTVFGLPTHPLIVHAVVVLLPLAALGGVAVALVPALRRRYGVLVDLVTLAGVGSVQLAESSGEHLYQRLSPWSVLILVTRIGHLGSEAAWNRLDRPAAVAGTGTEPG